MRIKFTHAIFDTYDSEAHGCPRACDVYVHEGDIGGANVCIRYGDEGHEYISAGTVLDFLCAAAQRRDWTGTGRPPSVAALLVAKLDFFCERRP